MYMYLNVLQYFSFGLTVHVCALSSRGYMYGDSLTVLSNVQISWPSLRRWQTKQCSKCSRTKAYWRASRAFCRMQATPPALRALRLSLFAHKSTEGFGNKKFYDSAAEGVESRLMIDDSTEVPRRLLLYKTFAMKMCV